jgi:hypothetical protein
MENRDMENSTGGQQHVTRDIPLWIRQLWKFHGLLQNIIEVWGWQECQVCPQINPNQVN